MNSAVEIDRPSVVESLKRHIERASEAMPLSVLKDALDNFDETKLKSLISQFALTQATTTTAESSGLSIRTRNELAVARMRDRAFLKISERVHFLDGALVCEILGISKQALSKRGRNGTVLVYTHRTRKYYPDFQFVGNEVNPNLLKLIRELAIDLSDAPQMNMIVWTLLPKVPSPLLRRNSTRTFPRYQLLECDAIRADIVREYHAEPEMGQ
jgi:hypothetical protein